MEVNSGYTEVGEAGRINSVIYDTPNIQTRQFSNPVYELPNPSAYEVPVSALVKDESAVFREEENTPTAVEYEVPVSQHHNET